MELSQGAARMVGLERLSECCNIHRDALCSVWLCCLARHCVDVTIHVFPENHSSFGKEFLKQYAAGGGEQSRIAKYLPDDELVKALHCPKVHVEASQHHAVPSPCRAEAMSVDQGVLRREVGEEGKGCGREGRGEVFRSLVVWLLGLFRLLGLHGLVAGWDEDGRWVGGGCGGF